MGACAKMAAPTTIADVPSPCAVDVEGGALQVTVAGQGAPLILLHGWTLDHRMWQPQIAGLARDFKLIMPDRRGFGRSIAPPNLSIEAQDIIRIANFFQLDRFTLLGLSQGAGVALDFACRFGSRLDAMIACGAPLPGLVERGETLDLALYRRLASEGKMATMRADWATHPLMQAHSTEARARLGSMLGDYQGRDLVNLSTLPDMTSEMLEALNMPVLALTGGADTPWRRDCAKALAQCVPHGTFALIEQAGHVANLDNPARFNALVGDFLRRHTPPQSFS